MTSEQLSPYKASETALEEILAKLRSHLAELTEQYSVSSLGVFGSYVRQEAGEDSDLDLLVEFSQTPTLFQYVRLQRHLSELLGLPVDLVMKKTLKPRIGESILSEVVQV